MNEPLWKIFKQEQGMATVPFGSAGGSWEFKTADPNLKLLENSMWASSSRLIVNENKTLTIEIRVGQVTLEQVMD